MSKKNAFGDLANVLSFDAMLSDDATDIDVSLDDLRIKEQEREEFEDDENSLAELGESLKKLQIQPIVIRPVEGFPEPYELVAGERRVRGARLVGLTTLRARIVKLTEDEAADVRFAENIHRKNLTQLEEAKRLQRDVDRLGMKGALAEHGKSQAWFSKRLALLSLPEQANRLVKERISADAEVITQVATIEKRNPKAAAELVDDLKKMRGKSNAREKVAEVKEKVKPSTKPKKDTKAPNTTPSRSNTEGSLAEPRDEAYKAPSPAQAWPYPSTRAAADSDESENFAGANSDNPAPPVFAPRDVLTKAYISIFENNVAPSKALSSLSDDERQQAEGWLMPFYEVGVHATNVAHTVAQNLRKGVFSTDNEGWFAFAAFLEGVAADTKFELLNILGSAKE